MSSTVADLYDPADVAFKPGDAVPRQPVAEALTIWTQMCLSQTRCALAACVSPSDMA